MLSSQHLSALTGINSRRSSAIARLVAAQWGKRHGKETSHQCDKCRVPLCIIPCFKLYHTRKNYAEAYNARHRDDGATVDEDAADNDAMEEDAIDNASDAAVEAEGSSD